MIKVKSSRSVHVSFREMKPISTLKSENMSLEITSYNTLRLINEEDGRRYTILSYRISNRDLGSNDTHQSSYTETDDYLSSWLKSKPYEIKAIEDKILEEAEYEQWSCDTLRRRLIGLNKLPNLDSLFESSADTLETTSVEERKFDELSSNLASTTIDISELDSMRKMFGVTDDSSSSNDDASSEQKEENDENGLERFIREMSEEQPMVDFSWLDYFHEPFRPGLSNDSAVTNKYFDDFIDRYTDIFGSDFYKFFVKKPDGMRKLIELKRSRELENAIMFSSSHYHDIV
jgi:bacterioferritin (cytochrome b1)